MTQDIYPPCPECQGESRTGSFSEYQCTSCNLYFNAFGSAPVAWEGEISFYLDRMSNVHLFAGTGVVNPSWRLLEKRPVRYEQGWGIHDMGETQ